MTNNLYINRVRYVHTFLCPPPRVAAKPPCDPPCRRAQLVCVILQRVSRPVSVDIPAPAAEADAKCKLPSPTAEPLASDATPAAVLTAFHRYRLNSVTDGGLQSNQQALDVTSAVVRSRSAAKETAGISATKKPGKLSLFFSK